MGVPTSEVGYTAAMPTRVDYEVHKGHVVALGEKKHQCLQGRDSGSPFHYSVSHFTFILLQKHIPDCAVSSELPFHRLIVVKRQRVGVSRSLL